MAHTICKDFTTPLSGSNFIGHLRNGEKSTPGCIVARCLALRAIPCTEEKFKTKTKTRLANLILGFPHVGWAYAPYKKPGKAAKAAPKDGNTKPLYEATSTDRLANGGTWTTQVTAYNFEKAPSNMDKGKRDDESSTQMRVGHIFTCFLNDFHFSAEKKDLFPAGFEEIPAYSIVDLHIAVTHNNSNGYGVKLVKIVPHASTLYSYGFPSSLGLVPANAAACDSLMSAVPETCKPSVQCFEQSGSIFLAKEVKCFSSKIDDSLPFIRITGVDDANSSERASWMDGVDIPVEALRKHTNAPANDDLYSMILLDVASKTGALSLLVSHDEYFAKGNSQLSTHRAVPLINVDKLLSCVDLEVLSNHVGEQEVLFALNCGALGDIKDPAFAVSMEHTRNPGGKPVECSDLSICHPQMQYAKGYKIQLVDLDDMGRSFSFVYTPNASAAPSAQQLAGQTKSYKRPYEEI